MEIRPYKNEHAARLKDPSKYDSFKRKNDFFKKGIHAIFGIIEGKSELQAIRFDASKYTVKEAKEWLKKNNFKPIKFEPAVGSKCILSFLKELLDYGN